MDQTSENKRSIPALIEALKANEPDVRQNATYALSRIHDSAVIAPLLEMLKDPVGTVRTTAAEGLGLMKRFEAIEALGLALSDVDNNVSRAAYISLSNLGNLSIPTRLETLRNPQSDTPADIAVGLGHPADERMVRSLMNLTKNNIRQVQEAAFAALSRFSSKNLEELYANGLNDPDNQIRLEAIKHIASFGEKAVVPNLLKIVMEEEGTARQWAVHSLAYLGDRRAVMPLLELFEKQKDGLDDITTKAGLRSRGRITSTYIIYSTYYSIIEALGNIGDGRGMPVILESYRRHLVEGKPEKHKNNTIGCNDCEHIEKMLFMVNEFVAPILIEVFTGNEFPLAFRQKCAEFFCTVDSYLDDFNALLSTEAARHNARGKLPLLITALKSPEDWLRGRSAEALGLLDDDRAISPLLGALNDPQNEVRYKVLEAIQRLLTNETLTLYDKDDGENEIAETVVKVKPFYDEEIRSQAVESLIDLLTDNNITIIKGTIDIFEIIKDPRTIEPLSKLLNHSEREIEIKAALALAGWGELPLLSRLVAALKTPIITRDIYEMSKNRTDIIKAIAKLTEQGVVEILRQELDQGDGQSQGEAIKALASRKYPQSFELASLMVESSSYYARWGAFKAFEIMDDERAIELLLPRIVNKNSHDYYHAMTALINLGDKSVVDLLLELLKKEHHDFEHLSLIESLGEIKDPRPIEKLCQIVNSGQRWDIRVRAVEALAKIGETDEEGKTVGALLTNLTGSPRLVQAACAEALGKLGAGKAVIPLTALIEEEDYLLREKAARALGRIGDRTILPALRKLADRTNAELEFTPFATISAIKVAISRLEM